MAIAVQPNMILLHKSGVSVPLYYTRSLALPRESSKTRLNQVESGAKATDSTIMKPVEFVLTFERMHMSYRRIINIPSPVFFSHVGT